MQENEFKYYESIGNWDFKDIKYITEKLTNWDFYETIKKNTNKKSLCLDLGTGGGEKALEKYPDVGMLIATDFSKEMIKTVRENAKNYPDKKIKFAYMDNMKITFPDNIFDLVSARHTIIDAKQIYNCLKQGGVLVIEGIDKNDCIELKQIFGRGQAYNDKISISQKDYQDIKKAGFSSVEKIKILENEYYKTEEDLMALLLKTPILDDFSEIKNDKFEHNKIIEKELFEKYVQKYKTKKGILLKRRLYGIIAKK